MTVTSEWFARRVERTPHRAALTFEGTTWTYSDLWQRVEAATGALAANGIRPDDRVAFVGANDPMVFVLLLAANRLGAALVPVNFRLAAPELAYVLRDAGVAVVVADAERQSTLDTVMADVPTARATFGVTGEGAWPELTAAAPAAADLPAVTGSDVAAIMYTSGTTGAPKGVVITHDNLWWGAMNGALTLEYGARETTMVCGPLFHVGGFCSTNMWTWMRGGHVVLHRDFDPAKVFADVARHRVRSIGTVNALLVLLAQDPGFEAADLSSLELIYCGGSPMPQAVFDRYAAKGVPIQMAYGSTESVPVMTILPAEFAESKRLSVGRPAMFVDLQLVDEAGVVQQHGGQGEVWVRGPSIFGRYWNQGVDDTRTDGWFRTGDLARWDDDGFLYIVDRLKDVIKTGGETVAPVEVERVLATHPALREVSVVGRPHEKWGETPVAVVVLEDGASVTLEELREMAGTQLARYKLPTELVIVDDLPKGPSGKVRKNVLREALR